MVDGLTSGEVTELLALEWLEPSDGERIDVGFAQMMALIYNRTRGGKESAKRAEEFMPRRGPVDRKAVAAKWSAQYELLREVDRVRRERG